MADRAHILTDKELEEMERHLSAIYARAEKELQEKVNAYFKRFEELDAKKRELVEAGKLTEQEYKRWRQNKIMTGQHWTAMKEQAAQELLQANRTAQEYINGRLPSVYTTNYNLTSEGVSEAVKGYSFELVDASTVKNLATSDKTLLPYKYIDGKKDVRWNTAKVNSEVLQGIVQGESIPNIAKRLRNVTEMNRASAIRNARTTVTSAENKGRMDMLHDAAEKGVVVHKVWMATHDSRVREAHDLLDGQEQDIDDPFDSELGDIMYPGDPDADPANVYNCRCTLTYKVVGFGKEEKQEQFVINADLNGVSAPEEYVTAVQGRYNALSGEAKEVYDRIVPKGGIVEDLRYNGTPHYNSASEGVYLDCIKDAVNPRGAGTTWFHEHGHFIDDALGWASNNDEFLKAIKDDVKAFEKSIKAQYGFTSISDVRFAVGTTIRKNGDLAHSVSDIFGGAIGKPYPMLSYSHSAAYWKEQGKYGVAQEAFAHMFEASSSVEKKELMETYLPKSWKMFNELIGGK